MLNVWSRRIGGWILGGVILLSLSFCAKDDSTPSTVLDVNGFGYSNMNRNSVRQGLDNFPLENLSAAEENSLLFMWEEERLAHDVYIYLFEKWNLPVFQNISNSEATHVESVGLLLDRYGLNRPSDADALGVYADTALQSLYYTLTLSGAQSIEAALKVGAAVEEIDILDLNRLMKEVVDNQDITWVYTNLRSASGNHLRAFVQNMSTRSITYVPQYMDPTDYQVIISSDWDRGRPF